MSVANNLANFGSTMNQNGTNYNPNGLPLWSGYLVSQPAGFGNAIWPVVTEVMTGGMAIASNRITVPQTGRYHIHAGALLSTQGNGCYLQIRKNGTTVKTAYNANSNVVAPTDTQVTTIQSLNTGDIIDFYLQAPIGTGGQSWDGMHSSAFIIWVG